ncbi:MAG: ParB/RepB/Spo0J family partition protein, partial [Myxococcota bacterium]
RQTFEEEALEELAASIREHGILQPIVVRQRAPQQYEIVAGERRWRAAQRAGHKSIRAVVVEVAERDVLTLALVENLQRQDLNAIEEAEAYQRLHEEFGHSQADIAKAVGKDRSTITNSLRLLKLPESVRRQVLGRELTMGHARALLALETERDIERAAREAVSKGWSVRDTERMVSQRKSSAAEPGEAQAAPVESAAERALKERLTRALGTRVEIKHKGGRGSLVVQFSSFEHLDDVLARMNVQ